MNLFVRDRNKTDITVKELEERLEQFQEKNHFFLIAILALLYFIKEFSLDIEDIESDKFKNHMDLLSNNFISFENIEKIKKNRPEWETPCFRYTTRFHRGE